MKPAAVGTRVKVIDSGPFDEVAIGRELVVQHVDNDGTFRGREVGTGRMSGWLRWDQVGAAGDQVGFDFLKAHLAPETVKLLAAFEGTENLRLKEEVRDRILLGLPDLGRLVREEASRLTTGGPRLVRRAPRRAGAKASAGDEAEGRRWGAGAVGGEDVDALDDDALLELLDDEEE